MGGGAYAIAISLVLIQDVLLLSRKSENKLESLKIKTPTPGNLAKFKEYKRPLQIRYALVVPVVQIWFQIQIYKLQAFKSSFFLF